MDVWTEYVDARGGNDGLRYRESTVDDLVERGSCGVADRWVLRRAMAKERRLRLMTVFALLSQLSR